LSWLQVELRIPSGDLDAFEAALQGLGALAVSLSDPGGDPILEPGPGSAPLWPEVIVTALLPAALDAEAVRRRLSPLPGAASAGIRFTTVAERDWMREFREQLEPLRFGEKLWICPAGTPCPAPGGVAVTLEPGLAFGSGSHPTTALCLGWLAGMPLAGLSVLDWGCGSGILGIAALALGARTVTAIDVDPQALQAAADNARRNRVGDRLRVMDPGRVPADARHDVVVANILADTLIALAPALRRHCQAGARIALSGILSGQSARVREACRPWLDLRLAGEISGWALLAGTPAPAGVPA
jgi:ribosomal protein L11 methyltransferase